MEVLTPDAFGLARAAELLLAGEVIAFPTDTVYGLAALAAEKPALLKIFAMKERPLERSLVLMTARPSQLESQDFPPRGQGGLNGNRDLEGRAGNIVERGGEFVSQ